MIWFLFPAGRPSYLRNVVYIILQKFQYSITVKDRLQLSGQDERASVGEAIVQLKDCNGFALVNERGEVTMMTRLLALSICYCAKSVTAHIIRVNCCLYKHNNILHDQLSIHRLHQSAFDGCANPECSSIARTLKSTLERQEFEKNAEKHHSNLQSRRKIYLFFGQYSWIRLHIKSNKKCT